MTDPITQTPIDDATQQMSSAPANSSPTDSTPDVLDLPYSSRQQEQFPQDQVLIPPPVIKKSNNKSLIVAVLLLLFATIPLTVSFTSQQRQIADIRNRAAIDCGAYPVITCPDGSQACRASQCPVSGGGCGPGSASCCDGKSPGTVTCGGAVGSCFINGQIDGHDVCGFQFAGVCPAGACVREGSGGGPTYWPGRRCNADGSGYIQGSEGECNAGNPDDTTCGCVYGDRPGDIGPMTCRTKTVPPIIISQNPSVANCSSGNATPTSTPISGNTPTPTRGGGSSPTPTPGGGGTPTPTLPPGVSPTSTPTPIPGSTCELIKVYNSSGTDITASLKDGSKKLGIGEEVTIATTKGSATKARFRIQGIADWAENDPSKTTTTEYRLTIRIPSALTQTQGTFEVEVFVNGVWK
ncbi:MAG: hypothetical protein AAB557_04740 [Patescibacteria group bacterium]